MAAVVGALMACAPGASGAEYSVHACGAVARYQNNLLTATTSDGRMTTRTECPTDGSGHNVGIAVLAGINKGTVPVFANAAQTFIAPAGTSIVHVHVKGEGQTWNGDWVSLLQASNDRFGSSLWNVSGCLNRPGSVDGCTSALANIDQEYDLPGATGFRAVVACGQFAGCTTFGTSVWPNSRAYYFMRQFDVSLRDDSSPSVSLGGGGLASGTWVRGTQTVRFDASDNSGIARTRFTVDSLGPVADDERSCDYTFAVPCSGVSGVEYSVDTSRFSDGPHRVTVDAADATNENWTSVPMTALVDNHAPAEPVGPSVDGGDGWHTTDRFGVSWSNPESAAPITQAFYELCKADGSGCSSGSQSGDGISRLSGISVGAPGDYTIRVWLMDAAGNVSDAKTPPLHLKFDNVPPAQAAPQHRNGWLNRGEAVGFVQEIRKPSGFDLPVSGIAGYAVSRDGSLPGTDVDVQADASNDYLGRVPLENLPEGTTTIKARAVSGAGVASRSVGETDLHVDRTPPAVSVKGVPDTNTWSRTPVTVSLIGSDAEHLSGMAGAAVDRDPRSGGYVEVALDDANPAAVPGPTSEIGSDGIPEYKPEAATDLVVDADGAHVVTFKAADAAGNASATRSVTFKIDQTPPELAVFEAQDRSDPRLITVAAADRTSGLADGGTIQLRRISPTRGNWITLHTTRRDDRYYAHIDNATLPEGDYEFEATIPDQAGNEATATSNREGTDEIIHISPTQIGPYLTIIQNGTPQSSGPDAPDAKATIETRMDARGVQRTLTRKCKPRKPRLRGRDCPITGVRESLVHDLRVPYGGTASIRGKLTTAAGTPIQGAEVTVLRRLATSGAAYIAEASVRTDGNGAFSYRAPAGPSRTLDFHYPGDSAYKHSDDQVGLRVPASATITVSRHRARNRQWVRFSGKLRGRPYPAKGKIVDLQAFYRNRWRTFATPRAGRTGNWTFRYRFEATRGSVLYKFRVHVRATSDYPYEPSFSRVASVRVVGR